MKRRLKKFVQQALGVHILGYLPRGIDRAHDIQKALPGYEPIKVFDVGANIGQSAEFFLDRFDRAEVYCFEPVSATFLQLENNLKATERVQLFQKALGASKGVGKVALHTFSDKCSLISGSKVSASDNSQTIEQVEVTTLDRFCEDHRISEIDYLKIDTEGGDLNVLKGGEKMLKEQKIGFVEVEAGMNANNKWHIPFETLKKYLESKNYLLFGFYEQISEFPSQKPNLRRANTLFISARMTDRP